MAPPKKSKKMDISEFLADDSLGGTAWADTDVDMGTIGVGITTEAPIGAPSAVAGGWGAGSGDGADRGSRFDESRGGSRPERKEFPIPDEAPFRARIGNLPWEVDEEKLTRHFESRMQAQDIISDVVLPLDQESGRIRGFGFVTFNTRDLLEESLKLNYSEFLGRKIFVSVAAPPRNDPFDGDWRSGRGPLKSRREEPVLDWGAARSGQASLPPRERSERFGGERGGERGERSERPPRRQEPELDWGAARNSTTTLPPRERSNRGGFERSERPPRKQEPELDWGAARSTHVSLPQRENRDRQYSGRGERSSSRRQEPELDWSRGQTLPPRQSHGASARKEEKKEEKPASAGPQKSSFSVLAGLEGDDDDSEEEQQESAKEQQKEETTGLESATAKLSVSDSNEDGWEVVGK